SDLGHCGRSNVRMSWIFVKSMLVINYFGQGAWLLANKLGQSLAFYKTDAAGNFLLDEDGKKIEDLINPFYSVMPHWFLYIGITIATMAAVVASQALISGSFSIINEAMR